MSPVTELTFRVAGSLTAEVQDSPLSRCLRGKAALLSPALAVGRVVHCLRIFLVCRTNEWTNEWTNERTNEWTNEWTNERTNEPMGTSLMVGRAVDAAAVKGADRAAAYDARVAGYIRAARAAATMASAAGSGAAAAGAVAGSGGDAAKGVAGFAAAMRVTTGDLRVTLVTGGGSRTSAAAAAGGGGGGGGGDGASSSSSSPSSSAAAAAATTTTTTLDAFLREGDVSAAEAIARAADAPYSDNVRLKAGPSFSHHNYAP